MGHPTGIVRANYRRTTALFVKGYINLYDQRAIVDHNKEVRFKGRCKSSNGLLKAIDVIWIWESNALISWDMTTETIRIVYCACQSLLLARKF